MKKSVKNFDDYILDMIVEAVSSKEACFIYTNEFREILTSVYSMTQNPIAGRLLSDQSSFDENLKVTAIDLDPSGFDMVSFIAVPKAIEIIKNNSKDKEYSPMLFTKYTRDDSILYTTNRSKIKIGRLVSKLYTMFDSKTIEAFVNQFKAIREPGDFELVYGDDIVKYYNNNTYVNGDNSLQQSCMSYGFCSNFIKFYSKNSDHVCLLILRDKLNPELIRGRALVWKLNEPKDRIFMDRVYYTRDSEAELFKKYAIDNGWLYRGGHFSVIIDSKDDSRGDITLQVNNMKNNDTYPYMDTLKYYNQYSEVLTNHGGSFDYFLESTEGFIGDSEHDPDYQGDDDRDYDENS